MYLALALIVTVIIIIHTHHHAQWQMLTCVRCWFMGEDVTFIRKSLVYPSSIRKCQQDTCAVAGLCQFEVFWTLCECTPVPGMAVVLAFSKKLRLQYQIPDIHVQSTAANSACSIHTYMWFCWIQLCRCLACAHRFAEVNLDMSQPHGSPDQIPLSYCINLHVQRKVTTMYIQVCRQRKALVSIPNSTMHSKSQQYT